MEHNVDELIQAIHSLVDSNRELAESNRDLVKALLSDEDEDEANSYASLSDS